jgi:hypothetical protein
VTAIRVVTSDDDDVFMIYDTVSSSGFKVSMAGWILHNALERVAYLKALA